MGMKRRRRRIVMMELKDFKVCSGRLGPAESCDLADYGVLDQLEVLTEFSRLADNRSRRSSQEEQM